MCSYPPCRFGRHLEEKLLSLRHKPVLRQKEAARKSCRLT